MGFKRLAYPIKKSAKAYYTMLAIDSNYSAVKEMERKLSLSEDVLRYVTSRVEKISSTPSAPLLKGHSSHEETPSTAAVENEEN